EVAVVCEVDGRGLVGRCRVVENELIPCRERVGHARVHSAWIALLTIGARICERHAASIVLLERLSLPDDAIEALYTAVQVIRTVVDGDLERRPVNRESSSGDAIAIAADDRSEISPLSQIVVETVEPQHDVVDAAAAIRRADGHDGRAEADRAHF